MLWHKVAVAAIVWPSTALVAGKPLECRNLKSCNNNPALGVLKFLKATKFCTDFLGLTTVTVRQTQTATATVPVTQVVSATVTVPYTETTSTTVSQEVVVLESIPGPSVTITTRPTATVAVTVTSSFSATLTITNTIYQYQRNAKRNAIAGAVYERDGKDQDAVAERERQLQALGVFERDLQQRKIVVPDKLKMFASAVISTACKCYVTAPTTTVKTTVTVTNTAVQTNTALLTASTPVNTVVVSILKTYTVTQQTTLPGITATETLPQTETVTDVRSVTNTATAYTTVTANAPGVFILQFSGNRCVQNKYTHYDLVNEGYTTPERLFQACAARCAIYGAGCKSFFAYQDMDYPYMWCIIDDAPYDPSYRQCNIPFSGVNLAYNSPY